MQGEWGFTHPLGGITVALLGLLPGAYSAMGLGLTVRYSAVGLGLTVRYSAVGLGLTVRYSAVG